MQSLLKRFDELAGIETGNLLAGRLERAAFLFLILMVLSAPHSIAATQTAWLSGMLFWAIRLFVKPRPKLVRTPVDFALWSFFGWSVATAIFSYAPDISLDKLRNVALFLIFYFVLNNLRNARAVKFLAFALIFSCAASAAWSPIERIVGRGVQISGVSPQSPLAKARAVDHDFYLRAKGKNLRNLAAADAAKDEAAALTDGDAIIEVEGEMVKTLDELAAEIEKNETTYLECFRAPTYFTVKVRRSDLLDGANSLEKLGVGGWTRSRNWRYAGFYGHIITYAEVLQLIASLVLGLFVALVTSPKSKVQSPKSENQKPKTENRQLLLLGACLMTMIFALLTTFTRSAQMGFLVSAGAIVLLSGNRKLIFAAIAVILPVALGGIFFLQQNRNLGFDVKKDESISYRQTVYREGFDLWTSSARNFFLGVGMDSVKRYKEEWHLFDDGRLFAGHFHSTPLQLLVERGLPALVLWLWILWIYARTLIRVQSSKFKVQSLEDDNLESSGWQARGIISGCFGGLIGFVVSSLVNYSLGDGEVAMVFFILMGIGVSLSNLELRIKNN